MLHSLLTKTLCQICMKSFRNGKALGGHMRSHGRKHSIPKAKRSTRSTIPTLQTSNQLGVTFTPRETVLVRSIHTNEVGDGPTPDLKTEEGGEQITGKKKFLFDLNEVYTEESEETLLTVEEGALVLVQMSKGKKPAYSQSPKPIDPPLVSTHKGKENCTTKYIEDEDMKFITSNGGFLKKGSEEADNDDEEADEMYLVPRDEIGKKNYKCDICNKILDSYQALGEHRKNHHEKKRLKVCDMKDKALVGYKCGICEKVFASGQALGGHKKIHLTYLQLSC